MALVSHVAKIPLRKRAALSARALLGCALRARTEHSRAFGKRTPLEPEPLESSDAPGAREKPTRGSSTVELLAHTQAVAGSTPAPATNSEAA